jgi:hypothetical protein
MKADPHRKPNSQAVLKNLPKEQQAQVFEWCEKKNDPDPTRPGRTIPKTGGYEYARAQLAAGGTVVSLEVIGNFYHWYEGRLALAEAEDESEMMKELKPDDARLVREWAEFTLLQRAKRTDDPKLLKLAAALTDSRRALDLRESSIEDAAEFKERELKLRERALDLEEFKARRAPSKPATEEVKAVKPTDRESSLASCKRVARAMEKVYGPVPPEYADMAGGPTWEAILMKGWGWAAAQPRPSAAGKARPIWISLRCNGAMPRFSAVRRRSLIAVGPWAKRIPFC